MTDCKSCGAPIVWVKTPAGSWMPCDEGLHAYKKDTLGKDVVVTDKGEVVRCQLVSNEHSPDGMARIPHWATCPYAKDFKRKKRN